MIGEPDLCEWLLGQIHFTEIRLELEYNVLLG